MLFLTTLLFTSFTSLVFSADYDNHWARDIIANAIENNIAYGNGDGDFMPDRNITRAEFITLLVNSKKITNNSLITALNDVSPQAWYFKSIAAAEEEGIVKGYSDGGFHPDEFLTRQDAITFVCRAYKINPPDNNFFISFSDINYVSDYAKKYVYFSINNNIISGYENNTIKPLNNITRAEALQLITTFDSKKEEFSSVPEFSKNYPKISPKGSENNVTVELKTTTKCSVYYKVVKKNTYSSYLTPPKEEINTFLASIDNPSQTVIANIVLDSYNEEYNIFFMPVSSDGNHGKIERLKDVKALAYSEGDGSVENPYIIYDENQLDYIRYCQNKHFKLANDLTLTKNWTPIDASEGYFGSLDGNGHKISNLTITNNNVNSGFFSEIKNGIIKNLMIEANVVSKNNVGIFAGKSENCTITGCIAYGNVTATQNNAGGIAGINNGTIENCLVISEKINSIANAGGIAGSGNGIIKNSLSAVKEINSDMYSGGIAGINNTGTIENCLAANLVVTDLFTTGSGRITTSKENGITLNNYCFKETLTNSDATFFLKDNNNGQDVSWNDIISVNLYKDNLNWNFNKNWKINDNTKSNFILPIPSAFNDIEITQGITPYAPIKISNSEEFKAITSDSHYMLVNSIHFNGVWDKENIIFNGSLNGNGFTLYDIEIPYSENKDTYALFGTINGAVRNLNIRNFKTEGIDTVSVISSENYGIIENCKIWADITADQVNKAVACASFTATNYGNILNCESNVNYIIRGNSITAGGIVSHNEGFIDNCSFKGNITISSNGINSSVSAGGITGFNNEGFIYNCYTKSSMNIKSCSSYVGGICGIMNSGEIFKASANCDIKASTSETSVSSSYTGGITGLSNSGAVIHSFSTGSIASVSTKNYSGGITGFNTTANIQNTYSLNTVSQTGGHVIPSEKTAYAGGICGYNESGFILSNVAINPWITSNGYIKRVSNSYTEDCLFDNYAYEKMITELSETTDPQNGIPIDLKTLRNPEFFFLPIYMDGKLGWSSDRYEEENPIWTFTRSYYNYNFPTLKNVKYQSEIILPTELR